MFRRIVLALTFVAALGAAGVGLASKAEAHGGCGYRGYGGGYASYYGYRNYYGGFPIVYGNYYPTYPTFAYPGGVGATYYRGGGHRHHHHRGHGGVSFSIGF